MAESLDERARHAEAAAASSVPIMRDYVDAESVRKFMASENAEATGWSFDLEFNAEQIAGAMVSAARRYNGIPPYIGTADPSRLSAHTNLFFDGIAAELLGLELRKLTKSDIDYSAGGVSANLVARRIGHLEKLISYHLKEFERAARDQKRIRNIKHAFRHI